MRRELSQLIGEHSIRQFPINVVLVLASLLVGCNTATEKEPPKANTQPPATKSFGQRQVDQMLDDRPEMRDALSFDHFVYSWIVEGFNGDRFGQRIYWNASSPQSGRSAEHSQPYGTYPPYIAISGGTETTAVDKWAAVVYEMFNLENGDKFTELAREAVEGHWDADEYAAECVRLEFVALKKTRDFFLEHPLPKSKHGRDTWYNWCMSDIGTYEDYEKGFDSLESTRSNSNYKYFRDYYEETLVPYAETIQLRE